MTDLTTEEHTKAHSGKIEGYRELNSGEIGDINLIKATGGDLSKMIEYLDAHPDTDKRWVAIAKTNLQQGIMAAVRSVAKPNGF